MSASISRTDETRLPKIVIVGRPNVGKSTLFNRLIGRRRAITDPTPGVTRDAVRATWKLGDALVQLVDTGGYRVETREMESLVKEKSLAELENAVAVLFVCDVEEFNAEDESFTEYLRSMADRVVVVVNKVDNPAREQQIWNFYSLGFSHVVGVSSAHGLGIGELEEKLEELVDAAGGETTEEEQIRISVMGKPNTGKSTLANRLVGREASIVSDIPGTTRDVIEGSFSYRGTGFRILDTAGIRRRRKVNEGIEYYSVNRAISSVYESDIMLLLIDAEEGLTEQDKKIAVQAVKRGKGVVLVLNKWDLIKDIPNKTEALKDRIRYLFPVLGFAPLVPVSAKNGDGIPKLLNTIYAVWRQLNKRVGTSTLNEMLQEWYREYEPPRGKHGHFKIFYGTQVSANPVRFVLFVNRREGFPDAYLQYLTNNIRKHLGFPYVPINIELRERPQRER
jgi:GTP-binding protein